MNWKFGNSATNEWKYTHICINDKQQSFCFLVEDKEGTFFQRQFPMEAEYLILFHVKTSSTYEYGKGKEDYG